MIRFLKIPWEAGDGLAGLAEALKLAALLKLLGIKGTGLVQPEEEKAERGP